MEQFIKLDDVQASNNWVISGKHTKNGKPILAGDPHLTNQLPTHWYLIELNYKGQYVQGSSHPGIPYVLIGRANEMSWSVTACLVDVSDLFLETLADGNHYVVDGKKLKFEVRQDDIIVKGRD